MNQLPPLLRDQRKIDSDPLNLLAIFHFVGAALAVAGIAFLFLHYTIMNTVFTNPQIWQQGQGPGHGQHAGPPPAEIMSMFRVFYVVAGLWFVACAVLNVLSGIFLRSRKHSLFS